jgi:hypothetical protein
MDATESIVAGFRNRFRRIRGHSPLVSPAPAIYPHTKAYAKGYHEPTGKSTGKKRPFHRLAFSIRMDYGIEMLRQCMNRLHNKVRTIPLRFRCLYVLYGLVLVSSRMQEPIVNTRKRRFLCWNG